MAKPVTIKLVTARVTTAGVTITGADTGAASERLTFLMGQNNGATLRDDSTRRDDRGAILAGCHALLRSASPVDGLATARKAHKSQVLACVTAPVSAITTGTTPASINMALDRDAKAFGATGVTLRAFVVNGMAVIYVGKPK